MALKFCTTVLICRWAEKYLLSLLDKVSPTVIALAETISQIVLHLEFKSRTENGTALPDDRGYFILSVKFNVKRNQVCEYVEKKESSMSMSMSAKWALRRTHVIMFSDPSKTENPQNRKTQNLQTKFVPLITRSSLILAFILSSVKALASC